MIIELCSDKLTAATTSADCSMTTADVVPYSGQVGAEAACFGWAAHMQGHIHVPTHALVYSLLLTTSRCMAIDSASK